METIEEHAAAVPSFALPSERDIDFLLVEELSCSAQFARWFLGRAGLPESAVITKVSRSVATWDGETDVLVLCTDGGKISALLVENKVGAALQPLQAERYFRRGDLGQKGGHWSEFTTVLLAPKAYLTSQNVGFHKIIAYEDLQPEVGKGAGELRAGFKRSLIAQAISRVKPLAERIISPEITEFFVSFRRYATQNFGDIQMPPESNRAPNAKWILIKALDLPRSRAVVEVKPHIGHIDLRLYGVPESDLAKMFGGRVGWQLQTAVAGKSSSIRLHVNEMDLTKVFEGQEKLAGGYLRAVQDLLGLIKTEKLLFERLLDLHPFPLTEFSL